MLHERNNIDFLDALDGMVVGHDEAKKALITLINRSRIRHYQKYLQKIEPDFLLPVNKLLLVGQSGTGKTFLVNCLQKLVDFPFVKIDATELNPVGSSGGIKAHDLKKMIVVAAEKKREENPERYFSLEGTIDQMVVFIDEIDKLGNAFESSGQWNNHVQSNFLTLFDSYEAFRGVSFIFAGAFSGITGIKTKNVLGFNGTVEEPKEDIDSQLTKAGLIPELVGRINSIACLDVFTVEDYYNILLTTTLPAKRIELSYFGIYDFEFTEEKLRAIAKKAHGSGQGIRALKRAVDHELLNLEFWYETRDKYLIDGGL